MFPKTIKSISSPTPSHRMHQNCKLDKPREIKDWFLIHHQSDIKSADLIQGKESDEKFMKQSNSITTKGIKISSNLPAGPWTRTSECYTIKETSTVLLWYSTSSNSSKICNSGSVMPNKTCTKNHTFSIKHFRSWNLYPQLVTELTLPVTFLFSTGRIAG